MNSYGIDLYTFIRIEIKRTNIYLSHYCSIKSNNKYKT